MFELNGITMEYVDLRPDELGVEYTGQRVITYQREYEMGNFVLQKSIEGYHFGSILPFIFSQINNCHLQIGYGGFILVSTVS